MTITTSGRLPGLGVLQDRVGTAEAFDSAADVLVQPSGSPTDRDKASVFLPPNRLRCAFALEVRVSSSMTT